MARSKSYAPRVPTGYRAEPRSGSMAGSRARRHLRINTRGVSRSPTVAALGTHRRARRRRWQRLRRRGELWRTCWMWLRRQDAAARYSERLSLLWRWAAQLRLHEKPFVAAIDGMGSGWRAKAATYRERTSKRRTRNPPAKASSSSATGLFKRSEQKILTLKSKK